LKFSEIALNFSSIKTESHRSYAAPNEY